MTLQGHFGLSQCVKAHISRVAAFKELINAKLSAGQSTVSGARVTEVKISKTLQVGNYSLKYYNRKTVPSSCTSHKKLWQYLISTMQSKADRATEKFITLVSHLSHNWVADSTRICRQP